ncbi:MAG: DNA-binding protein [Porphyromonadaceae bacterium CG2_30_38_12]|nr:MAG: DNA-binding protein [Porphyromonadaceae bacterium CG2_30_38_12]
MTEILWIGNVEDEILIIRNQKVILDSDVAYLYSVKTKEVNQAVKNNPEKFPFGYVFELSSEEQDEVVKKFDHLQKLKFSSIAPKAFTEKGLYMLATILKSQVATETTINIIETFTKTRELSRNIGELVTLPEETKQKLLLKRSGELISDVLSEALDVTETSLN